MSNVVTLRQVTKKFGNFTAVDNVCLQVAQGEVYGFLGPNGAGKSTTLRMMLSLIQPTSGMVELFGKDLSHHRSSILQRIGCIIEKPDFYLYLSGLDNLKIFGALSQTRNLRERIAYVLDLVGLKGREKDRVKTYSHGMKQRLGIAQALLHDPELIILDEPTTGLDPQGIIELRNLILYLKAEMGKTILLSSHILSEIEMIADSMVIIHQGKAVVEGKVSSLLSLEDLQVRIQVNDSEKSETLLRQTQLGAFLKDRSVDMLKLECNKEAIPAIIATLSQQGIEVFSVQATRSLEDYFLRITASTSDTGNLKPMTP